MRDRRFERFTHKLKETAVTVSLDEAEYASRLYNKYLNYLEAVGAGMPRGPLTEKELNFLKDVTGRMAHHGKVVVPPTDKAEKRVHR
jgi:hypothetical protein